MQGCIRTLPTHYELIQTRLFKYIENFTTKKWKCSDKNFYILHISDQNIDCGYSLEPPRRDGSNEYPRSMFWAEIRKIMYTTVNPSFTIQNWGLMGSKLYRHVFVMPCPLPQHRLKRYSIFKVTRMGSMIPKEIKAGRNILFLNLDYLVTNLLSTILQLTGLYQIVVNCTGLGSKDLLNDSYMYPTRGHIIRVSKVYSNNYLSSQRVQPIFSFHLLYEEK